MLIVSSGNSYDTETRGCAAKWKIKSGLILTKCFANSLLLQISSLISSLKILSFAVLYIEGFVLFI